MLLTPLNVEGYELLMGESRQCKINGFCFVWACCWGSPRKRKKKKAINTCDYIPVLSRDLVLMEIKVLAISISLYHRQGRVHKKG